MPSAEPSELDIATVWLLAARAMAAARHDTRGAEGATTGLYAQAILGLSEDACLEAKRHEHIGTKSLVDCLAGVRRLPHAIAEKIVIGVMLIAYGDRTMQALEVRWASMLASAANLTADDFQRCCASSRVIAGMMLAPETPA